MRSDRRDCRLSSAPSPLVEEEEEEAGEATGMMSKAATAIESASRQNQPRR
jgi:hypothetical protein